MFLFKRLSLGLIAAWLMFPAGVSSARAADVLIDVGESWHYFKGYTAPPANWNEPGFDTSTWESGPTGIGYSSDISYATTLSDMRRSYLTFYLRKTFHIDQPESINLKLVASYDDGFIAYINGVEVARSTSMAGQTGVNYRTRSGRAHDEEAASEEFDLAIPSGILVQGTNVLAIEVHNASRRSSDAGIVPVLLAEGSHLPGQPPQVSPIESTYIDVASGDEGMQIYANGGANSTLSAEIIDADGDSLTWQWFYSVNGAAYAPWGSEENSTDGEIQTVSPLPFDYSEVTAPASVDWQLRVSDGTSEVMSSFLVHVISPVLPATLIGVGEEWKIFKGTAQPPAEWNAVAFDDSDWLQGPSGIGYSSDLTYPTTLDDMYGNYLSLYLRKTFSVEASWEITELILDLDYDDGFIAYLNGVEVARSDSMAGQVALHNTASAFSHDEEAGTESFDLSNSIGSLLLGINVLAIQMHNVWELSSDAAIVPQLRQAGSIAGPAEPSAVTGSAVFVESNSAVVNGQVNPNGYATESFFAWGEGSLSNSTPPIVWDPETVTLDFAEMLAPLETCTSYSYRAMASNSAGGAEGEVRSFRTSGCLPLVTTLDAEVVSPEAATLSGHIDPNGVAASTYFEWGGAFENSTPAVPVVDAQSPMEFSANVTGLSSCSTYLYRAVATSPDGTTVGDDLSFHTGDCLPTAVTLSTGAITSTSAELQGEANPGGSAANSYFDWGSTPSYGQTTSLVSLGDGTEQISVTATISGLTPCTTYFYRAVTTNIAGSVVGDGQSFATGGCIPEVATLPVSNVSSESATLHGLASPMGLETTVYFDWGLTESYTEQTASSVYSGTDEISVGIPIAGLIACTTYHYRMIGVNSDGSDVGGNQSFSTIGCDDPEPSDNPPPAILIDAGDTWKYFKGTSQPSAGWQNESFDDSGWLEGPSGFGYSTDISYATELSDMQGNYLTFYIRKAFVVDENWTIQGLNLEAAYDDGFIAYVNGVEVARSQTMAGLANVTHATNSGGSHDEEAGTQNFDLSSVLNGVLEAGVNVIAIEVHNVWDVSSDAGIVPILHLSAVSGEDLTPPDNVSGLVASGYDGGVSLSWTEPADPDFSGTMVLQGNGQERPVAGNTYAVGQTLGASTVVSVGEVVNTNISGLSNGDEYTFTVYSFDPRLNYSSGAQVTVTPQVATTETTYVDNTLPGHCDTYDPASRSCSGGINTAYVTFAAAAANSSAADTVAIRGGIYSEVLHITTSGTAGNPITFKNYGNEPVIIDGVNSVDRGEDYGPIWLDHVSHVVVEGIQTRNSVGFGRIVGGGNNTLREISFLNTTLGLGSQSKRGGLYVTHSQNNRIVDNTFSTGTDMLTLVRSDFNVIEGNTFTNAGHTLAALKCSSYNVVRNNVFSNNTQKGLEVFDCEGATMSWHGNDNFASGTPVLDSTKHNVIEGNRFVLTGSNESGSQSTSDSNGIQYSGQQGIIRQNVFYNMKGPALGMQRYGDEALFNVSNRVYSNVVNDSECGGINARAGVVDNIYKNNILSGNEQCDGGGNVQVGYRDGFPDGHVFINNNIYGTAPGQDVFKADFGSFHTLDEMAALIPSHLVDSLEVDPQFVSEAGRDYSLQPGSPMIDSGAWLTQIVGTGEGTRLQVVDASYFFDGFGIAGESGDLIQLQSQATPVRIVSIDYVANILTLETAVSFSDGLGVSLPFNGSGPDLGTLEAE